MKKKIPEAPTRPRPFAVEFTPTDYKGDIPKLSPDKIASIAKRDGEILKAHGVTMEVSKAELLQAKKTIEPPPLNKEAPAQTQIETAPKQAQAPPQAEATAPKPLAQEQQAQYRFSEKAKEYFAKFRPKAKEQPQQEQEQTKTKAREKDRER